MDKIQDKLKSIDKNVQGDAEWAALAQFGNDLHIELRDVSIFKSISLDPVNMGTGSVEIYLTTLPNGIYLKLWCNSGTYYLAFFKKSNEYFDVMLTDTFNDRGVMPLKDLDEAEDRILDFVANELYKDSKRVTLKKVAE